MKKEKVLEYQNRVLKVLADKADDFYLAGGTALALFYFHHRQSVDLDFFTPDFSHKRVKEIVSDLGSNLKKEIKLVGQNLRKDKTRMMIYDIYFTTKDILKIDFVEDVFRLIKNPRTVDGVKILSLEDIYLRKVYAIIGVIPTHDAVGRKQFAGGRIEGKDFYDLYFLSHTFMPLFQFADKYGDAAVKEGIISWFRTYDRMQIMDGILRLDTDKKCDYKNIEKHFREEVDRIIESLLEGI